jgi:hypothetical protein
MSGRQSICANCEQEGPHHAHGLCPACYAYEWRYSRPRPRYLTHGEPRVCVNPVCSRETPPWKRYGGRCGACAIYWQKHGTERPLLLVARLAWRQHLREEQAG